MPQLTQPASHTPRTAWIALAILMTLYLLSYLDKQMLSLLLDLIAGDLKLSDTQMGVLSGLAFSLTYSIGVLATGWAVDRFSARWIIFTGVIVWSLASAAGGLATNFSGMFTARAFVGLGEAALSPAAIAILAAVFPRDRLSLAAGIYHAGANIGGLIALALGGAAIGAFVSAGGFDFPLIGHARPWQAAFIVTGLPGIALAFLIFGIRTRDVQPGVTVAGSTKTSLLRYVGEHKRFFSCYYLAISMLGIVSYTLIAWSPAYFGRAFHLSHAAIGISVGVGVAAGGVGNILWGALSSHLQRKGYEDAIFRVFAVAISIGIPLATYTFIFATATQAIVLYALTYMFVSSWGAFISALQLAIPDDLRGRTAAVQIMLVGLIGIGLAPLIVGAVTDHVFGGKAYLGYSIALTISLAGGIAVAAILVGRKAFVRIVASQASASMVDHKPA